MRTLTVLALALVPALSACPGPVDCDTAAAPSVQLVVESSGGGTFTNLQATFTGGSFVDEPCESFGDTDNEFICGYEVAGTLEIVITADEHEREEIQVEVAEDECHVITESETVELLHVPEE